MTIDEFREMIMGLRPGNFMALGGDATGILGSTNNGVDAVQQLQRAVIEFTNQYKQNGDGGVLDTSRKNVIAKIMVAATMDAISEEKADELVDTLQKLMKERN